jgi:hypothetical protein
VQAMAAAAARTSTASNRFMMVVLLGGLTQPDPRTDGRPLVGVDWGPPEP